MIIRFYLLLFYVFESTEFKERPWVHAEWRGCLSWFACFREAVFLKHVFTPLYFSCAVLFHFAFLQNLCFYFSKTRIPTIACLRSFCFSYNLYFCICLSISIFHITRISTSDHKKDIMKVSFLTLMIKKTLWNHHFWSGCLETHHESTSSECRDYVCKFQWQIVSPLFPIAFYISNSWSRLLKNSSVSSLLLFVFTCSCTSQYFYLLSLVLS